MFLLDHCIHLSSGFYSFSPHFSIQMDPSKNILPTYYFDQS